MPPPSRARTPSPAPRTGTIVLPALDLALLQQHTFGDSALECEVLELFRMRAPRLLAALRQADAGEWRLTAHTLKGSAAAIGAVRLARAAGAAEALGSAEARTEALDSVSEELLAALGEIARRLAALREGAAPL